MVCRFKVGTTADASTSVNVLAAVASYTRADSRWASPLERFPSLASRRTSLPVVATPILPRVRAVVLNFDGGPMTLECLHSLAASDWPADRLELVLVDNASVDGIDWEVRDELPQVQVIENFSNEGFAARLQHRHGRPRATSTTWRCSTTTPYVPRTGSVDSSSALEADPGLGAAVREDAVPGSGARCPARRARAGVAGPPPRADDTMIRLSGIRIDGRDVWDDASFSEGFHPEETGDRLEPRFRWMKRQADLFVPRSLVAGSSEVTIELRLMADTDTKVRCPYGLHRARDRRARLARMVSPSTPRAPRRRDQLDRLRAGGRRLRARSGVPGDGPRPVRRARRGVCVVRWRRAAAGSVPARGRAFRSPVLPVLRRHRTVVARSAAGMAIPLRARRDRAPSPRGVHGRGQRLGSASGWTATDC